MKKKEFKGILQLRKKVISSLQTTAVQGGNDSLPITTITDLLTKPKICPEETRTCPPESKYCTIIPTCYCSLTCPETGC